MITNPSYTFNDYTGVAYAQVKLQNSEEQPDGKYTVNVKFMKSKDEELEEHIDVDIISQGDVVDTSQDTIEALVLASPFGQGWSNS